MDLVFLLRISVCFILSILIGLERQYRHKMVGLRTNVLVSLGAFMFNWVTFCTEGTDKTRIAAQVVSGIGFLGAGVIIRDGNSKIRGLNTAATLWCVAAIGVMTSSGLLVEAAIGTLFVLISNVLLRIISLSIMNKVKQNQKELCNIRITCDRDIEIVIRSALAKFVEKNGLDLISLEKNEVMKNQVKLKALILTSRKEIIENLIKSLSIEPGVSNISWNHRKYSEKDDSSDEE